MLGQLVSLRRPGLGACGLVSGRAGTLVMYCSIGGLGVRSDRVGTYNHIIMARVGDNLRRLRTSG